MIELNEKIIIAIDGYSSCGKSTFAKIIANELNYLYIDSGAMYRAVSYFTISKSLISSGVIQQDKLIDQLSEIAISFKAEDSGKSFRTYLNDIDIENEIRDVEVSAIVSSISKIPEIREYLVGLQKKMGNDKGIVMDGRDIGTVVYPEAEIKIFMTAGIKVRAKRRYEELINKGIEVTFEEILNNIKERDFNDENRKLSPLKKAKDADLLDNSDMSIHDQMKWFRDLLMNKGYVNSDRI